MNVSWSAREKTWLRVVRKEARRRGWGGRGERSTPQRTSYSGIAVRSDRTGNLDGPSSEVEACQDRGRDRKDVRRAWGSTTRVVCFREDLMLSHG